MGLYKIALERSIFHYYYCRHVWMCHSRKLNNKISRLQERTLCIAYNHKCSTFYQLLEKFKSVTIHTRNLQYLVTETFKVKIGILPTIITEFFKLCENATHNLRSGQIPERRHNRRELIILV